MIEALLVVLSNAVAGRDDDFNDWYTHIHTRDAMRFRGSIAQQRFVLADEQVQDFAGGFPTRYLALYEAYDAQRFTQEHIDAMNTPRMVIEDSFDARRINDFYYYPRLFWDNAPRASAAGSVVLEQFNVAAGQERAFQAWYATDYLPRMAAADNVVSGALLAYDPHGQMLNYDPEHSHVAIYRLSSPEARAAWRESALCRHDAIDGDTLAITCWDVLTDRVTEDDVHHPRAAPLAAEEAARARIERRGTRVVNDGQMLRTS